MPSLLLTAGATRNPVDAIRYLSANATGATAIALLAALDSTFDIHLLGSAEALLRAGHRGEEYTSTRDLGARMERWLRAHAAATVVHSAAVGDYEVPPEALANTGKIASGAAEIVIRLVPTPKLVDRVHEWCPDVRLVSFKAGRPGLSPDELEAVARAQLRRTRSELVFANVIGELATSVLLVGEHTTTRYAERQEGIAALATYLMKPFLTR
jgi:phosphopantothenoylcysteine decarboxylase/phosphopantothenate--cysteine ligase